MNFETCDVETLLLFKEDAENKNDLKQRRLLKILLKKLITEGKTIIKKKTNKNVKKCVDVKRLNTNKVDLTITSSTSRVSTATPTIKIETVLKPPAGPPALLCVTCLKPFDTKAKHVCEKETQKIENPVLKIDVIETSPIETEIETIEEIATTPANSDSESESEDNDWFEEQMMPEPETKIRSIKKKQKRYKDLHFDELITFECSICDKDFLIESELDKHIKSHNVSVAASVVSNENKILKCRECDKILPSRKGLKLHIRSHFKDWLKYKCKEPDCNKLFSCKGSLEKHIFQDHNIRTQPCHICNKLFSNKYKLQRHINSVHLRLYTHICPICGKLLLDETGLQRHISSHSDLKPYQCDQCTAAFKIKADLTVHLRVHTGERPFLCTVCQRTFTCNSNLHKHMRSHGEYVIVKNEGLLK